MVSRPLCERRTEQWSETGVTAWCPSRGLISIFMPLPFAATVRCGSRGSGSRLVAERQHHSTHSAPQRICQRLCYARARRAALEVWDDSASSGPAHGMHVARLLRRYMLPLHQGLVGLSETDNRAYLTEVHLSETDSADVRAPAINAQSGCHNERT
jgi:hypothetical protein